MTGNYGEAGAIARYGPDLGIDAVYSGHNALWAQARPPASATSAVFVGGIGPVVRDAFAQCADRGRLHTGLGLDSEEEGARLTLCTGMTTSWSQLWPQLAHLD